MGSPAHNHLAGRTAKLHGLVHDGDSVSADTPGSLYCYPFRTFPSLHTRTRNFAIAGATINVGSNNNILNRLPIVASLRPKVVTIGIGGNDLGDSTTYPATSDWLAALWNYTDTVKARLPGVKIGAATLMNRGDVPTLTARRAAANAGILAGVGTHIDAVFDFGNHPIMGLDATVNDPFYFQGDTIHPTEAGQAIMDELYRPVAMQLLGMKNPWANYDSSVAGTNPHGLTQFTHYWDAGDENTVMGASVCSQIDDQIGSLNIRSTTGIKAPLTRSDGNRVNGLNALTCHQLGTMKSTNTVVLTDDFHVFFAMYHENNIVSTYYLTLGEYTAGAVRISLLNNTTQLSVSTSGVGGSTITGSTGVPSGPVLYEIIGNKTAGYLKLMKNGVQVGSNGAYTTGWGGNPITVQLFQTTGGPSASDAQGRFMALGIAASELTGTTLTNTRDFIRNRFAIY